MFLSKENINQADFLAGTTILVDKPKEWSSFDVVNKIRHKLKHRLGVKKIKVGHAGTLDPMATGLLIICTGKNTKKIEQYQGLSKRYSGTIKLGATTPTYDAESAENQKYDISHIGEQKIIGLAKQMLGEQSQMPPIFSALKINGQAAYKLARKGKDVTLSPRTIRIDQFDIIDIQMPQVHFDIVCSKGTYIRSIAYDFGRSLDSGGYLTTLVRDAIGDYLLSDAWNLEELSGLLEK